MITYVVRAGDHLTRLAYTMGFDAAAVWAAPENEALRALRASPDMLAPGDVIHLPEPTEEEPLPLRAGASNRFLVQVPTVRVRLALGRGRDVIANEPWRAEIPGEEGRPPIARGTSDADGHLEIEVPADVTMVRVTLETRGARYDVRVGDLDPIETTSGLRARLRQLGYFLGPGPGTAEDLSRAIWAFQYDHELPPTGVLDDDTRQAIVREHGS